jgi:hypothetical protein
MRGGGEGGGSWGSAARLVHARHPRCLLPPLSCPADQGSYQEQRRLWMGPSGVDGGALGWSQERLLR